MAIPDRAKLGREVTPRELAVWHQLIRVVGTAGDLLDEQLRDIAGVTIAEFLILNRLNSADAGTMTMTDLADGQAASRSGMTHRVDKLEKLGLVRRRTSAADERAREVTLTDAGRERVAELAPHHRRLLRHLIFDQLGSDDLDDLETLLGRLSAHLDTAPPRSVRRRNSRAHRVAEGS
ncbi:MarR family winged helix-turn-helix transcriptional regulator [Microlunatus soli]|uniref:DNA-binding transcriptional regulator, MarR family n=1 Tax=Microlunatus soli TaxID=630515 RepID=A0A1H1Z0R7_9ACTN|nr:MarR family transcriptional regulator [Microlunatus soli]SDT27311.1 DNA-binding transcriptional regulator, MarR family [Microlunatus soli]